MTKKHNQGSHNQNSPTGEYRMEGKSVPGDNSKGNKRNKDQKDKTEID